MTNHKHVVALLSTFLTTIAGPVGAQHQAMPPGLTHEEHLAQLQKDAELKKRGAAAMGFDQDKTTHHFILAADGGSIGCWSMTQPIGSPSARSAHTSRTLPASLRTAVSTNRLQPTRRRPLA